MWCHTDDIIAWFIMRKSFFGLKHDVYIGNVYIVPENFTYLKHDAFDILYRYIEKIPDNAEVLLCVTRTDPRPAVRPAEGPNSFH